MNDARLERIISVLLRTGVILSAVIVFSAGVCYLVRHGHEVENYNVFQPAPGEYRSVSAVIHALGPSNCRAIIQFGLLLLIATPIARTAFSMVGFTMERDWTYVGITAVVLTVLIYSIAFEH